MRLSATLTIVVALLAGTSTSSVAANKWYTTRCSCNNVTRYFIAR
jgi:hypothetical protein